MYNFGKTDDLPQNLQMKQAYKMYQYAKKLQNTYKIPTFSYFKDRKIPTFLGGLSLHLNHLIG